MVLDREFICVISLVLVFLSGEYAILIHWTSRIILKRFIRTLQKHRKKSTRPKLGPST